MRYARLALGTALVLFAAGLLASPARAEVSFSAFYSNLSPYGSWQVSAQYGRVWQPVEYHAGWNPYYDGHWAYSDLGWAWVSDYEWGAIPYHYGTWVMDPYYGWVWVPGYTWAPAWVTFRTGPDYIGWAPVAPGFSVGFSAGFPVASSFVFVSAGNFLAPHMHGCILPPSRASVIINNTHVVNNLVVQNNIVVNRGPDPRIVERATGRPLRAVPIERVSRALPGPGVGRAQLRADPEQVRHGLRAASPVPASRSLPAARAREDRTREERNAPAMRDRTLSGRPRVSGPMPGDRGPIQRVYGGNPRGGYPAPRERYQTPDRTQARKMAPGKVGPSYQRPRSTPQEYRAAPSNRIARVPAPPAGNRGSAHKEGRKPHDSGKN